METPMYRMLHTLMNLVVAFIAMWAVGVSILTFFGMTVYFPFTISDEGTIPYHRLQTIRIAVFMTMAYFTALHLFRGSKEYFPIQFLEIYLKVLTLVGMVIFYQAKVEKSEFFILLFFGISSIILHLARRSKHKYFSKKHNHFK